MVPRNAEQGIEKRGAQQPEQTSPQPFEWNFAFATDPERTPKKLNPIDQITVNTHRPDGNYEEHPLSEEDKTTIREFVYNPKTKDPTIRRAHAVSIFSGNEPVAKEVGEHIEKRTEVKRNAIEQELISKANDGSHSEAEKEKLLAKLPHKAESEFNRYVKKNQNIFDKRINDLENKYGQSFQASRQEYFKAAQSLGRAASKATLVTPIATPETHTKEPEVIKAPEVKVVPTPPAFEEAVAANKAASQQDAKNIDPIGVVSDRSEQNESIASQEQEAPKKQGFLAGVKSRWNKITKNEKGNTRGTALAVGALAIGAATLPGKLPTKESVAQKVSDNAAKLNTMSYKLGTRMAHSRVNEYFADSEKGFKRRIGLRVAMVVGGAVVAYAFGHHFAGGNSSGSDAHEHVAAVPVGGEADSNTSDDLFNNDTFGQGSDRHDTSSTDTLPGGRDIGGGIGTETPAPTPEAPIDTAPVAPETPAPAEHIQTPEGHPAAIELQPGDNPYNSLDDYMSDAYPDVSVSELADLKRQASGVMMYSNGFEMSDSHNLSVGTDFDMSAVYERFQGRFAN